MYIFLADDFIQTAVALGIYVPILLLCYIITRKHLRVPWYALILFTALSYLLSLILTYSLLLQKVGVLSSLNLVFLLFNLALYNALFDIGLLRATMIFLWSTVLISFSINFTQVLYSLLTTHNAMLASGIGQTLLALSRHSNYFLQIIILCLAFLIVGITYLFIHGWNVSLLESNTLPNYTWLAWMPIPILFLTINLTLLSICEQMDSYTIFYPMYLFYITCNILLYLFLTQVFYATSQEYILSLQLKESQRFYDLQNIQYESLKNQIDRSTQLRHDFKHTVAVLTNLATEGKLEEIQSYLKQYNDAISEADVRRYCSNPAVNAILNYYAGVASTENIHYNIRVEMPESLPMSEQDICSVIGNLLENAIHGCLTVPETERELNLTAIVKNEVNLLIVCTNSFDGNLQMEGNVFLSTSHSEEGIGTQSIRNIVESHGGNVTFYTVQKKFFAEILLRLT